MSFRRNSYKYKRLSLKPRRELPFPSHFFHLLRYNSIDKRSNLDKANKAKRTSEERENNEKRTSGRLQDELKAAQANIRAVTRDKENQVAARKFDAEIKKDELRDATE